MDVLCTWHVWQAGQVAGAPALLVLDEVDAALDETNQRLVASLLKVRGLRLHSHLSL
jgi:ABC-type glutathione transport system ATPase component